jgi:2-polyprenyl-6-methoxyphenol hydroxylase-like FAD-dependent oxidoreductase
MSPLSLQSIPSPVLVAGAGVSGLALAQGLVKRGIDVRIFERDPENDTRTQGYRFRISQEGINALRTNLPEALYREIERCCPPPRIDGNVP